MTVEGWDYAEDTGPHLPSSAVCPSCGHHYVCHSVVPGEHCATGVGAHGNGNKPCPCTANRGVLFQRHAKACQAEAERNHNITWQPSPLDVDAFYEAWLLLATSKAVA